MKAFLRTLIYLVLSIWLGAEAFFPVVAARVFTSLNPDRHAAGRIVGQLLITLHGLGLLAAALLVFLLVLAFVNRIYRAHHSALMLALVLTMASLTFFSKYAITPAMEQDRIVAGGIIDNAPESNPARMDFERLHEHSVRVEKIIMLFGLLLLVTLARAESAEEQG